MYVKDFEVALSAVNDAILAGIAKNIREGITGVSLYTGWPKKVSHYQIVQKFCQIVLKSAHEIKFLRKIKKNYQALQYYPSILNILCVTYFLTSIALPDL